MEPSSSVADGGVQETATSLTPSGVKYSGCRSDGGHVLPYVGAFFTTYLISGSFDEQKTLENKKETVWFIRINIRSRVYHYHIKNFEQLLVF